MKLMKGYRILAVLLMSVFTLTSFGVPTLAQTKDEDCAYIDFNKSDSV